MKLGVCAGPEAGPAVRAAGFDFVEVNVQASLKPEADEAAFQAELARLKDAGLPCLAANCLLPGDLRVTGPGVNPERQDRYLAAAFTRAQRAGIETIVFGSGGARRVPDGFERERAMEQLREFGRRMAPLAAQHGVTVVVEPLNLKECNIFTTVGECARYVREIGHPSLRLLVDGYHWARDNDSAQDLVAAGDILRHAHVATYASRLAPGAEPCDFGPFFRALRQGGYQGSLTIEGRWGDLAKQGAQALAVLREALAAAGL